MAMGRIFRLLIIVKLVLICIFVTWVFTGKALCIDSKTVVGNWECKDFPQALLVKLGLKNAVSRLEIKNDGSFSVSNFPERSPYRLIPFEEGAWEIKSGNMTPSGKDSIYLNGHFLSGAKSHGVECLEYVVSGKDELKILYFRIP